MPEAIFRTDHRKIDLSPKLKYLEQTKKFSQKLTCNYFFTTSIVVKIFALKKMGNFDLSVAARCGPRTRIVPVFAFEGISHYPYLALKKSGPPC
jgi:hypothetical protein